MSHCVGTCTDPLPPGSATGAPEVSYNDQELHRASWEYHPANVLRAAFERAPYIDQGEDVEVVQHRLTTAQMVRSFARMLPRADTSCCQCSLQRQAWLIGLKKGLRFSLAPIPPDAHS